VRRLGVLRLGLAIIAGQLVGALVLDLALPVHDEDVGPVTVLGVALTLVAVAVSGRGGRGGRT
jgi:transporter family-2 protein